MLTEKQISEAKRNTAYRLSEQRHEHDDCIRIAYEWLDAQKKTSTKLKHRLALKHIIENWAGRYISTSDVEVAATLHPDINGEYPHFNISSRLTLPSDRRLANIPQAKTQNYSYDEEDIKRTYSVRES